MITVNATEEDLYYMDMDEDRAEHERRDEGR